MPPLQRCRRKPAPPMSPPKLIWLRVRVATFAGVETKFSPTKRRPNESSYISYFRSFDGLFFPKDRRSECRMTIRLLADFVGLTPFNEGSKKSERFLEIADASAAECIGKTKLESRWISQAGRLQLLCRKSKRQSNSRRFKLARTANDRGWTGCWRTDILFFCFSCEPPVVRSAAC